CTAAAVRLAVGALNTRRPSPVALRNNSHRSRKRMQSELFCRRLQDPAPRPHGKRRQRIWRRPRALEWIRARGARYAQLLFHFRVVRFKIGVTKGPVLERCSWHTTPSGPLLEIHFMKAPEVRCKVNRAAADLLAVEHGWL